MRGTIVGTVGFATVAIGVGPFVLLSIFQQPIANSFLFGAKTIY
jgi:hypothetical protein